MATEFPALTDKLRAFIQAQKMFFVATAPRSDEGRVNVSPKGYDSLAFIDDTTIAWLDMGGSGVETIAHLKENGRITLMWCAFEGKPNIVRIRGKGEVVTFDDPEYESLLKLFPAHSRARSIIIVKAERIADSCGWGVPFYEFKGERDQLQRNVDFKPVEEWKEYRYDKNGESIDGLPGLVRPK